MAVQGFPCPPRDPLVCRRALYPDAARILEFRLQQNEHLHLEHYLIEYFGDLPLRELSTFAIQVWLNRLVEEKNYSESVVGSCFSNIRATKPVEKPVIGAEQLFLCLGRLRTCMIFASCNLTKWTRFLRGVFK
jgi:hypothetical protein